MIKKKSSIYITIFVLLGIGTYFFYYPCLPVTLPDAYMCQYLEVCDKTWILIPNTYYKTHILTEHIHDNTWVVGNPKICTKSEMDNLNSVLLNPFIYHRQSFDGASYVPRYAYRLKSKSCTLIAYYDDMTYMFQIEKYDLQGKCIFRSPVLQDLDGWWNHL